MLQPEDLPQQTLSLLTTLSMMSRVWTSKIQDALTRSKRLAEVKSKLLQAKLSSIKRVPTRELEMRRLTLSTL